MPYDDDRPKVDRRTGGDWVFEEVDEQPNAVDNNLDIDKPKETTLQNDERSSAITIRPDYNGKNASSVSVAFPLQAASLPAKCKTFSHFEMTFADYESCEAYEQEPKYSPELYEVTLSRDYRENYAQQEDFSNQLEKGDPGISYKVKIERFLEEHNSKTEVNPTRPFQRYGKGTHPFEPGRERFLISQGLNGKISLLSDGMRYLKPISKVYGKVISRIRSGVSWQGSGWYWRQICSQPKKRCARRGVFTMAECGSSTGERPHAMVAMEMDLDPQDYMHVLENGPWVIMGHYLTVFKWQPNFRPSMKKVTSTLAWVRFPKLPLEFFEKETLMAMGKAIGKVVKIDNTTMGVARGRYARILSRRTLHMRKAKEQATVATSSRLGAPRNDASTTMEENGPYDPWMLRDYDPGSFPLLAEDTFSSLAPDDIFTGGYFP
ncbi:hypothetical protein M9H77_13308 [Catharanthus roseus]|uniref:Uncharacterized protein n=1 Tax=Catharanthus roseus TaxID=4058 RepID=A0ACC0BJY2_CATRO|nr:hypothetical protein M9H77_13308 [Catharanthus roseus]